MITAISINILHVAAALGFAAPLFILLSLWYARDSVGVSDGEIPVFKTGNADFRGTHGPAVPPASPADLDGSGLHDVAHATGGTR